MNKSSDLKPVEVKTDYRSIDYRTDYKPVYKNDYKAEFKPYEPAYSGSTTNNFDSFGNYKYDSYGSTGTSYKPVESATPIYKPEPVPTFKPVEPTPLPTFEAYKPAYTESKK